jgi:hypothetical protein
MRDYCGSRDTVYVVLRVFDIEGAIGLKLYVDPAGLEGRELLFTTNETWSVVPGLPSE